MECSRKDGYCKDGAVSVYQLDIDEVEECSLGPEYADIDVKEIFREATEKAETFLKSSR